MKDAVFVSNASVAKTDTSAADFMQERRLVLGLLQGVQVRVCRMCFPSLLFCFPHRALGPGSVAGEGLLQVKKPLTALRSVSSSPAKAACGFSPLSVPSLCYTLSAFSPAVCRRCYPLSPFCFLHRALAPGFVVGEVLSQVKKPLTVLRSVSSFPAKAACGLVVSYRRSLSALRPRSLPCGLSQVKTKPL